MTDNPKVTATLKQRIKGIADGMGHGPAISYKARIAVLTSLVNQARAEGFADAQWRAAGAVEKRKNLSTGSEFVFLSNACNDMAKDIRALKPQSEKKGAE